MRTLRSLRFDQKRRGHQCELKPVYAPSWAWLLALYTIAGFFETVFWGQLTAFTPLYLPRLGIDPGEVARWTGLIAALTGAAGLPFLPFWGALADRFSRQPVIVRSFVVYLLAGTLALLAGNVWVFTLGRAVMSLALGNSGLMMTTLSERTPPHRQGLAFAIMNSAGPVGVFLGPLVGGPVVDHWGFRALLAINIAIMVVVVMTLSFGYRDAYRGASRQPILTMAVESVWIILRSTRLRSLFVAFFFLYAGWMLALTYLPLVVGALYSGENEASAVGLVLGGGGLVALVLGPFFGWLADRYGHWRVLQTGGVLAVILWPLPGLVGWGVQLQSNQGLQQGAAQPGLIGAAPGFRSDLGHHLGPGLGYLLRLIQRALRLGSTRRARAGDVLCLPAGQPGLLSRPCHRQSFHPHQPFCHLPGCFPADADRPRPAGQSQENLTGQIVAGSPAAL